MNLSRTRFTFSYLALLIVFPFCLDACSGGGTRGTSESVYSGSILSRQGLPLQEVTVTIGETGDSTTTDENGQYSLETTTQASEVQFFLDGPNIQAQYTLEEVPSGPLHVEVDFEIDEETNEVIPLRIRVRERERIQVSNNNEPPNGEQNGSLGTQECPLGEASCDNQNNGNVGIGNCSDNDGVCDGLGPENDSGNQNGDGISGNGECQNAGDASCENIDPIQNQNQNQTQTFNNTGYGEQIGQGPANPESGDCQAQTGGYCEYIGGTQSGPGRN